MRRGAKQRFRGSLSDAHPSHVLAKPVRVCPGSFLPAASRAQITNMTKVWRKESTPRWDADKARIVGGAPVGVFDARYKELEVGSLVPGSWWRVEDGDATVGYGWLDVVWGDAEILVATDPSAQGQGVGTFILAHLEEEAASLGLNRLYNIVRPTHPDKAKVSAWLAKRGFLANEDGSLFRTVPRG